MNKEAWDVISDILEAMTIKFQECELEIAKLKFKIKQLERQTDDKDSSTRDS